MFQFPAFAFRLISGMIHSSRIGLPHSEIRGSIRICQSPRLIAAYHVLRRLPEPRHPPCALMYFIFSLFVPSVPFAIRINPGDAAAGLDKYLAFCCTDATLPRLYFTIFLLFLLNIHHVKDRFSRVARFLLRVARSGR